MDAPNEEPKQLLSSLSIKGIAEYIKTHDVKKIVIMNGAGISTSAGIPDFRSAGTGLYSLLGDYGLEDPQDIFDISFFNENPRPFYRLASELLPGKFRPTIVHSFVKLLEQKGLLKMCFTQNIDTLERQAGVSDHLLVEAHGSFNGQVCGECRRHQPEDVREKLLEGISTGVPVHCAGERCNGYVKPSIVFFGEALPMSFVLNMSEVAEADLAIIMGTSLTVAPFATLPQLLPPNVPRLLINKYPAGDLGSRLNDVVALQDCDAGIRMLARECGWLDELESLWADTALPETEDVSKPVPKLSQDDKLAAEIEALSHDVDKITDFAQRLRQLVSDKILPNDKGSKHSQISDRPAKQETIVDVDQIAQAANRLSLDDDEKR